MQRNYTVMDVKRYREEHSCGLHEAIAHFERSNCLESVDIARMNKDFDLLCDVVRELVNNARF
jgi:hypothetical protein